MTRETKIGLLVGLAFIIVIGILLSDHLTSSIEPPQAKLTDIGPSVKGTVSTLGSQTPPITIVTPTDVQPQQTVPTASDLQPRPEGVNIVRVGPGSTPTTAVSDASTPSRTITPALPAAESRQAPVRDSEAQVAGADAPTLRASTPSELAQVAAKHGEPLVDASGHTLASAGAGTKEYTAEPGDTLYKMAAKTMGASNKANRDALIKANPSLQADPNKIIVGKTYLIPSDAAQTTVASNASREVAPAKETREVGEYWYTVKDKDSLWKIANDQLRNPAAVAALQELNDDVLHGTTNLKTGMKLRLPAKPVAMAN